MKLMQLLLVAGLPALAGCATDPGRNMPLVFGQTQTLGISIGTSTTDPGVDLTLGFKARDIAVVPVTVVQADGGSTLIKSTATDGYQDAFSVLGQFEASAKGEGTGATAGLGKFFATGMAAKKLADGFAGKLSGQACPTPVGN
jgi:hypothetical protein